MEFFDAGYAGVVFVSEGRDGEEDEVCEKTDLLHSLAAVEFVVDEECYVELEVRDGRGFAKLTSKIISNKGNTNIDQIIQPTLHD